MLCALMLYDEKYEDISYYLSKESLTPDDTSVFKNVVAEHISHTLQTVEYRLPSLGKEFLWLNTSRPLSLEEDLGKKVCVIDFFTYCCINCLHILPYLKEVETKHADNPGLAVIGIHCPKFPNEKHVPQVKDALIRNNIKHPVLNDPDCMLWTTFGITCWPTVYIVGPGRIVLFILMGEREIEKLPFLCDQVLKYFESCSIELDTHILPISEIKEPELSPDFLYPGNVSTNGEDILVSDTGHNRLLLMSSSLEIKEIIGSGNIGCNDGTFNNASFNSPHGTVWHKNVAYVADTGNHSIRKVDFKEKFVDTIFDPNVLAAVDSKIQKFCSPWDVCLGYQMDTDVKDLNMLYIAVSGSHQIWALDLGKQKYSENFCVPFAGSGQEENRPNCYRFRAGFAQPSGIAYSKMFMPDTLFVADSESSTIKSVSLRDGVVKNIVGGGLDPTDLFQYGDKDGKGRQAKLQHPMSVCVFDCNTLIVADTYNHKIKTVDVTNGTCQTVQTIAGLNEPSGICIFDKMLVIADTNNHRIVTFPIYEMLSENIPKTFDLEVVSYNMYPEDDAQAVIKICDHAQIFCYFSISSCEKLILNEKGIQRLDISFKGNKLNAVYRSEKFFGKIQPSLILQSCLDKTSFVNQQSEVTLVVSIPMCDKELGMCYLKKALFKIIVNSTNSGVRSVCLKLNLNNELKLYK